MHELIMWMSGIKGQVTQMSSAYTISAWYGRLPCGEWKYWHIDSRASSAVVQHSSAPNFTRTIIKTKSASETSSLPFSFMKLCSTPTALIIQSTTSGLTIICWRRVLHFVTITPKALSSIPSVITSNGNQILNFSCAKLLPGTDSKVVALEEMPRQPQTPMVILLHLAKEKAGFLPPMFSQMLIWQTHSHRALSTYRYKKRYEASATAIRIILKAFLL